MLLFLPRGSIIQIMGFLGERGHAPCTFRFSLFTSSHQPLIMKENISGFSVATVVHVRS